MIAGCLRRKIRYQRFIQATGQKEAFGLSLNPAILFFSALFSLFHPHTLKFGIYYNRYWCLYSSFYPYKSMRMYFLFIEMDWINLFELSGKAYFKTIGSSQASYNNSYYSWIHKPQKPRELTLTMILPLDRNSDLLHWGPSPPKK